MKVLAALLGILCIGCSIIPAGHARAQQDDPAIYLDQTGYLPKGEKRFFVDSDKCSRAAAYFIIDCRDNSIVWQGNLGEEKLNDRKQSGKTLWYGDFGPLEREGTYRIVLNGRQSYPFRIQKSIYRDIAQDALHSLSLVRANVAVDDAATSLTYAAGHLEDFTIEGRDYSGGWYNAGDYGKWTHCTAITIANLLWLHERQETLPASLKETLLEEARWGMEWLLKMQDDSGAVWHKVDTEPDFAWGKSPAEDTHHRSVKWTGLGGERPSSVDAGDFTGAAALCARVFSNSDQAFSLHCRKAAEKSWEWLLLHPDEPQTDPYYSDNGCSEEFFWAAAEMWSLAGDSRALDYLNTTRRANINLPVWTTPDFYGTLALIYAQNDLHLQKRERDLLVKSAYELAAESGKRPFRHANASFWWGSNHSVSGAGQLFAAAWQCTDDEVLRRAALDQLHYLLGRNALGFSFVAGHGTRRMEHPYHWAYRVFGIALPGWIAGGPNPLPNGADEPLKELQRKNTPPALCYLDLCAANGSWASNEGTIDMVSSLLFLAGILE